MIGRFLFKEGRVVRVLWPLVTRYRWAALGVIALGVLASLLEGIGISLFIPLLQSVQSDGESGNRWVTLLNQIFAGIPLERRLVIISLVILGSVLARALAAYGGKALYLWLRNRTYHDLVMRVYQQLLAVSLRFIEKSTSGHLYNLLTNQTLHTSNAAGSVIALMTAGSSLLIYVALLFVLSWRLTLLALGAMLFISLVIRLITRRAERLGERVTETETEFSHRVIEGLEGMTLIRTFGTEAYETERLERASRAAVGATLRKDLIVDLVPPISELLAAVLLIVMLNFSLRQPENISVLLVFIFLLYRLQPRIGAIDAHRAHLDALTSPVTEVKRFLEPRGKPFVRSGNLAVRTPVDALRYEAVSYSYDNADAFALRDISFEMPANKTTALVGPSGAGKSTLIKLLLRFYDPASGTISLDGTPLPDLDLGAWRARIATVSQDIYIFNASVRDNIAYSAQGADEDAVMRAAKYAHAHDFIMDLPQGYDTLVGDRGVRLSGGQKQRLSLARAFLRDPDILILDEATNALDSISEQLIQQALERFGRERTVVVIAHRLATIRRADHIVVLDEGRVRETGTFDELVAQGGLFSRLHKLQFEEAQS